MKFESDCGHIWLGLQRTLFIKIKYITIGKSGLLYTYLSRRYGRGFKVFKQKVKGSDRDVSTVVLRVFVSRIFPFILLTVIAWFLVQLGNNMHS